MEANNREEVGAVYILYINKFPKAVGLYPAASRAISSDVVVVGAERRRAMLTSRIVGCS